MPGILVQQSIPLAGSNSRRALPTPITLTLPRPHTTLTHPDHARFRGPSATEHDNCLTREHADHIVPWM